MICEALRPVRHSRRSTRHRRRAIMADLCHGVTATHRSQKSSISEPVKRCRRAIKHMTRRAEIMALKNHTWPGDNLMVFGFLDKPSGAYKFYLVVAHISS